MIAMSVNVNNDNGSTLERSVTDCDFEMTSE